MRLLRSRMEVPEEISEVKVWTGIGSKFRPEMGRNWRVLIRARSAGIAAHAKRRRRTDFPKVRSEPPNRRNWAPRLKK